VTLRGGPLPGENLGEFLPVDIVYRRHVRISGSFVVPLDQYQAWPAGAPPLSVESLNGDGDTVSRPIELVRLPLGDGGVQ
jgi:hypothetical protein